MPHLKCHKKLGVMAHDVIPSRLKWEDHEFEVSLSYVVSSNPNMEEQKPCASAAIPFDLQVSDLNTLETAVFQARR